MSDKKSIIQKGPRHPQSKRDQNILKKRTSSTSLSHESYDKVRSSAPERYRRLYYYSNVGGSDDNF